VAPVLVTAHLVLGVAALALVAGMVVVAGPPALRGLDPPAFYLPARRLVTLIVGVEVGLGLLLLLTHHGLRDRLHLLYAAVALLVMPVAGVLARPGRAALYQVGGAVVLLGVLFRLLGTG
jgi:hypothetical protein